MKCYQQSYSAVNCNKDQFERQNQEYNNGVNSQNKTHAWSCKYGQEIMTEEFIDNECVPPTILLEGHSIETPHKFISF